ncbi:hypothetical protein I3842_14G042700 [Carya illinoinensis]|uniref:Rapid ALkalinization Factor n=1 Tax=Carya illinoinensis TaxID=32201 RepID=A0A922AJ71_CARIL|nr:hypothetical protein I3842_14G042700 [Carya illinoinensis]
MVVVRATGATNLSRHIFNPCKLPEIPHLGCPKQAGGPPKEANPYNRGCNKIFRCRR